MVNGNMEIVEGLNFTTRIKGNIKIHMETQSSGNHENTSYLTSVGCGIGGLKHS